MLITIRKTAAMMMLSMAFFSSSVFADEGQSANMMADMVKDLQVQMAQMKKTMDEQALEIRALKSQAPSIQMPSSGSSETAVSGEAVPMSDYEFNQRLDAATGGAQKWLKDLKFAGDLRLRYEGQQYTNGTTSETDDRNRFRYRLRFGFEKKFSEDLKVGFGLASGETTSGVSLDPTSTNQTLDGNFNFKPIMIEKAYVSYMPSLLKNRGVLSSSEFSAGKVNNPFEKGSSDMIWDRDVKPEGAFEKFDFKLLESEDVTLNSYFTAGQFILDEDATVGGDANLFAYQIGLNPIIYTPLFEKPVDLLSAVSFYDYGNYARKNNFTVNGTAFSGGTRGNPNSDEVSSELDAGQFKVVEFYQEVAIYPFPFPTRFFFDAAHNLSDAAGPGSITEENDSFAYGVKLGSIVKKGDWEFQWAYKTIGANSVVGAFNDSDFGDGHAGKAGNLFKIAYALTDSVTLNSAAFFVHNLDNGTAGVLDQEQRRFQVDLNWKF